MTTIRSCSPADISKLNLCNLDPLTENYARKFYFDYLAKWPTMFIVAENQKGQIVAYGKLDRLAAGPLSRVLTDPSHGQG